MLRYAIVDATVPPGHAARLASLGIDYIQLRAKSLSTSERLTLARNLAAELLGTSVRLLINSRADIALAAHAHGVHLTSAPDELTPDNIRTLYCALPNPYSLIPNPCTISLSCHTLSDIIKARTLAPDLILFGPIFEKRVDGELVQAGIGLAALEAAVGAADGIPVLALGGITQQNTAAALATGAAGIAGIRLFT
jgi:thiamine-phosphate pyrophosphorylase